MATLFVAPVTYIKTTIVEQRYTFTRLSNSVSKMMNLGSSANEYFQSLNPIAKRICEDVQATRENYESAWNHLSEQERTQVLDESLIYPDAVLKYSLLIGDEEQKSYPTSFPVLQISYGQKVLQDETGAQWRDEHSAPFSWKTSSQLHIDKIPSLLPPRELAPAAQGKKRPPVPPPKPPKPSQENHETADEVPQPPPIIHNNEPEEPIYPNDPEEEMTSYSSLVKYKIFDLTLTI